MYPVWEGRTPGKGEATRNLRLGAFCHLAFCQLRATEPSREPQLDARMYAQVMERQLEQTKADKPLKRAAKLKRCLLAKHRSDQLQLARLLGSDISLS